MPIKELSFRKNEIKEAKGSLNEENKNLFLMNFLCTYDEFLRTFLIFWNWFNFYTLRKFSFQEFSDELNRAQQLLPDREKIEKGWDLIIWIYLEWIAIPIANFIKWTKRDESFFINLGVVHKWCPLYNWIFYPSHTCHKIIYGVCHTTRDTNPTLLILDFIYERPH